MRNLWLGGPTSVPITVSAVSEKPVAACAVVAGPDVDSDLAVVGTTVTAATATRLASALIIPRRVALVPARSRAVNCRAAAPD